MTDDVWDEVVKGVKKIKTNMKILHICFGGRYDSKTKR